MLRCALFTPDLEARQSLALAIGESPGLLLLKAFDGFLDQEPLLDYIRAHSPQILFFDISHGRAPLVEAALLLKANQHTHLIAVGRTLDAEVLLELMNIGVREFLRFPLHPLKLAAALARIESVIANAPEERESSNMLFSFLPAKPGVGSSVTALHTALELAQRPHSRVLFADLDLNWGVSRFLLKIANPLGIRDAIARIPEMDDALWAEIKSTVEDLDILPPGLIEARVEIEPSRVRALLEFVRRRYRIVLADLSGSMEHFSVGVLQQSRRIMLVVEPDLAAVHMAREKMRFLEGQDLHDRVSLVVNRWRKDAPLTIADIESVLGVAAEITISEASDQIYKSVMRGGALDPASTYFHEIAELAGCLASESSVKRRPSQQREPKDLSLIPSRYSLTRV